MYSIVIPYLSTSKYIEQCKHYLKQNSALEYELVEIVDETDVYYAFNKGVYQAKYDKVVLLNDDMIVSKNWDINFVKAIERDVYVTGHVVEHSPGVVYRLITNEPVKNIKHDCGTSIETFDYNKFQHFADTHRVPEILHNSKGWYMPFGVFKQSFVSYPNIRKFPESANDIILLDLVLPNLGYKFAQVKSFFYHFQGQSLK